MEACAVIEGAIRKWLGEQKRSSTYRELARDVDAVLGHIRAVSRTVKSDDLHSTSSPELRRGDDDSTSVELAEHAVVHEVAGAAQAGFSAMDYVWPLGKLSHVRVEVTLWISFKDGSCLKSKCRTEAAPPPSVAEVELELSLQTAGRRGSETTLAEFHGQRSSDFSVDEAKYNVDFEAVKELQEKLAPAMAPPKGHT
mmetsp:Transcript_9906/g.14066  ORF Transcript_9906/g.14066 Transcript_9906/m.14066 type:complete len:197 (+) Transcript_9906:33-623(+)